jgi:MYXO-CTERM domain-containing protein
MRKAIIATCAFLLPLSARAQTFPPEASWLPLHCGGAVMTDPYRDFPNAIDERDVVGLPSAAAGFHAADDQFLYLRIRVDGNPMMGTMFLPTVWGFEFDIDANPATYEILVSASGATGQVAVFHNSTTTIPDSPADPADTPPVAVFPFSTHLRVAVAGNSSFGNNPDYFVAMAVPWSTLQSLGLGPTTPVRVWAGTSTADNALDLDIACQDGAGGAPTLSGTGTDRGPIGGTTGGTGGAGGAIGPVGENGLEFEGGPSCSCNVGGQSEPSGFAWLVLLAFIRRGRRCGSAR